MNILELLHQLLIEPLLDLLARLVCDMTRRSGMNVSQRHSSGAELNKSLRLYMAIGQILPMTLLTNQ